VFLAKGEGDKYSPASLERLRESLRQFLKACERAIELNRSLIGSEQLQFQKSIEEGFRSAPLQPLLGSCDTRLERKNGTHGREPYITHGAETSRHRWRRTYRQEIPSE